MTYLDIIVVESVIEENVLISFIRNTHTPQRCKIVLETMETILGYDIFDIVPAVENIILNDDYDTSMKIEFIKSELIECCKQIAATLRITPYAELTDFKDLHLVIRAVEKAINDYHPDYILENTQLESPEPAICKIHDLVKLIEGQDESFFYNVVHSVHDDVPLGLLTLLNSKVVMEIDCDDPVIVSRYKNFIKGQATGVVTEYIRDNGSIGTSEAEVLILSISEAILALPPMDRARDVISAILISDAEDSEIKELVDKWIPYFANDDSELILIEAQAKSLISS